MRYFLHVGWAASVLGLLACAEPPVAPAPMPRPTDLRSVSPTFLEKIVVRQKTRGVTMRIYDTGAIETRGMVVSSMKSLESRINLSVPVFLIQHPKGRILFDTGISTATAAQLDRVSLRSLNRSYPFSYTAQPKRDIVSQLQGDGVDPASIRWIILSHLHLDHAGLVDQFPGATLVVSWQEWEAQKKKFRDNPSRAGFDPSRYEKRFSVQFIDLSTGSPFGVFDHSTDLFSDGSVILMGLPGHTAGSMGAWVNLDGGPVFLVGDASWVIDNYMNLSLPIRERQDNLEAYWRTENEIHVMQDIAPRLVIFPGHDLTPRALSTRDDLPLVTPVYKEKETIGGTMLQWLKGEVGR